MCLGADLVKGMEGRGIIPCLLIVLDAMRASLILFFLSEEKKVLASIVASAKHL